MIIKKINFPVTEMMGSGLGEIKMSRLDRFVAMAGRNGAGKSRILDAIEKYSQQRSGTLRELDALRSVIENMEHNLTVKPNGPRSSDWISELERAKKRLAVGLERIFCFDESRDFKVLRLISRDLNLQDWRSLPNSEVINRFNYPRSVEIDNYAASCLSYIQQLQNHWFNASHQNYSGSIDDQGLAIDEYEIFREMVGQLLGTTLERDVDGISTMFGRPIADAKLSDGQKIILQLCVALHAKRAQFDNTVFLLDEPENHLHPSAVIELLETLRKATATSQIWIATHSIPLLAYVASADPMFLWYVEDGQVAHAGRRPQTVLSGLLGGDDGIQRLNAFTGLPAQLAAINYANESLLPPKVVSGEGGDPQVSQIQRVMAKVGQGNRITVLDIGAGKGRLLDCMGSQLAAKGEDVAMLIDYFAFDLSVDDKVACERVIRAYFSDDVGRYFNDSEEFYKCQSAGDVSIVVMCNVLHEISPLEWIDLFSAQSLICRSMREDGYLLLVEDQRIPVGERAHEYGFIVLDTAHLRTLFCVNDEEVGGDFFVEDARRDGRLKAHLIGKKLLTRVSTESRRTAIEQLMQTAKVQIGALRKEAPTYANGQLHGFWTQQFANSAMLLDELNR